MVTRRIRTVLWAVPILAVVLVVPLAAPADAEVHRVSSRAPTQTAGSLVQLPGVQGCIGARSARKNGCATARAMKGPGPFMGSRAIALSPDGRNVYVASSSSDAVAIFVRNKRTGGLTQPKGAAGCVAANAAQGCATAVGLDGPNSIAISSDGRYVYVTSRNSNSLTAFRRNNSTGSLQQLVAPTGCISGAALSGCSVGRALDAPDVVVISNDGKNVYVGSFFGNAVVVFNRNGSDGTLAQPTDTTGCIAAATDGCAVGLALKSPEGLAISSDGNSLYVASAVSNAVAVLARNTSTGTLTQASDGSGCIVDTPLTGCTTGRQLAGANAIALSPDGKSLYATSLFSNSVTSFDRSSNGSLVQKPGIFGCIVNLGAANCSFGRAMAAPEGLVVSPDGRSVYVAAFTSGAIDVLDRNKRTGAVTQKNRRDTCVATHQGKDCTAGRALKGISSIAVSPDGRYVYSTSFRSNAVDIFKRRR